MKLAVHILQPFDTEALAHLTSLLAPGVQITQGPDFPAQAAFHILVAGRPQRKHIIASPSLRALVIPWAGLPETTRTLMRDYPHIAVHNLHYNAIPTAEMAVSLLLAAAKRILPMDRALRENDWTPRYERVPSVLLANKTALILGYGAIGRHVAHICQALEDECAGIRRNASEDSKLASPSTRSWRSTSPPSPSRCPDHLSSSHGGDRRVDHAGGIGSFARRRPTGEHCAWSHCGRESAIRILTRSQVACRRSGRMVPLSRGYTRQV